jgi:hypothetical protein
VNPFNPETLRLVFIYFVPGFISMKVYDMLVPSERRDFSKSLLEAVSFSSINFAILYWPLLAMQPDGFQLERQPLYSLLILFLAPSAWPFLLLWLMKVPFFRGRFVDPVLKPWDRFFQKNEPYWVIVHLKDGRKVAGKYGKHSFTSTYPAEEQIYLEEVWEIEQSTGRFLGKIDRTHGILVSHEEYQLLEFFK